MKIAILNFRDSILSSVIGPYEIFSKATEFLEASKIKHNPVKLTVDIVTDHDSEKKYEMTEYHPNIEPSAYIQNNNRYDLVIIPGIDIQCLREVMAREKNMIEWIRWQYSAGAEIASLCIGTFLLASTGLLNGKDATTHWMAADLFRSMFPEVRLLDEKIIVDNGRLYSSGGAFSFTSLLLYLVEKYLGRQAAVHLSKIFLIHIIDTRQTTYAILNLQKNHGDKKIQSVQKLIEENYYNQMKIEYLAEYASLGVRTFIRKFKKATGSTPYEYIQRVRIEAAKRNLEESDQGVEQICNKVGYADFSAFRKVFRKYAGTTPTDYKKHYSKVLEAEDL